METPFTVSIAQQVQAIGIQNGGSGYTSAPTVTVSAPVAGVTATATAAITGGVVTSITVTNGGSGYTTMPTVTLSGGGGSNAYAQPVMMASAPVPTNYLAMRELYLCDSFGNPYQ